MHIYKNRLKNLFASFVLSFCILANADAQVDPHFSQNFVYPSTVNPALTGAFNGDFRITGIFRNQWANISNGFKTFGLSAEAVTNKNVSAGINVFNQTTGTGYVYQHAYASFAYTGVKFGTQNTKQLTFALQAGYINKRFDRSKFETGEQWNNTTGYNSSASANELLPANSSIVFDAGAGILYYDVDADKKVNPFIGFSVSHLTSPEERFLAKGDKIKLPMKFTGHASVNYYSTEDLIITPTLLFIQQENAREIMAGLFFTKNISDNVALLGGLNYRYEDAFIPAVGIEFNAFKLGASYDVSLTDIGNSIYATNSFEMSLSYLFKKKDVPRGLRCPQF
jgi:type IX secretion system PorP/SprF family membrane protein